MSNNEQNIYCKPLKETHGLHLGWVCFQNRLLVEIKGELNPKTDFSSFEHLGIVEQLYEVSLSC